MTGVSWIDAILIVCMALGVTAGAFSYARNQQTYIDLAVLAWTTAKPHVIAFFINIAKRNTPEVEARMNEVLRRGGEWDNVNKRERRPR